MNEEEWREQQRQICGVLNLFCDYAQRGLIGGQIKEKFGSIRWYAQIAPVKSLHDIVKNGHYFYRYGADDAPVMNFLDNVSRFYLRPFTKLIFHYQKFMYAYAYRKAIEKFPDITEEILASCDHNRLLFKREARIYKRMERVWQGNADV